MLAPIATLRNLNIVQKGKSSKPAFRSILCGSQDFKPLNLFVFAGRPAFFHFGPVDLRFSGLFLKKQKQEPNFLTRDILLEMKLTLSSAASSMLHEVNFK